MTHMDLLTCTDWRIWDTSKSLSLFVKLPFRPLIKLLVIMPFLRIISSWWIRSRIATYSKYLVCYGCFFYETDLEMEWCIKYFILCQLSQQHNRMNVIYCILSTSEPMDLFENIDNKLTLILCISLDCHPAATNTALLLPGHSPDLYFPAFIRGPLSRIWCYTFKKIS